MTDLQIKEFRAICINLMDAIDALIAGMKEGSQGRLPVMSLHADLAQGVLDDLRAHLEKGDV
jgi:hypothetical protein